MNPSHVTMLFHYGSNVAVKICYPSLTYDGLVEFVCRKWNFMEGRKYVFTYHVNNVGECYLTEDEDVAAMFVLIRRYELEQIDVQIDLQDGLPSLPEVANCLGSTSETRVNNVIHSNNLPTENSLMSASWSKLIDHEGQVYPGGAKEFRKALIKYSTQVGFEFKYLRNEPDRVTAECKLKNSADCGWKVHAIKVRAGNAMVIHTLNNVHNCGTSFGASTKKKFNSKVVVDLIADDIRNMPGISPRDVQSQVKVKFGVDISYFVAWKATEGGRARVFGDHSQSYSTLAAYLDELQRSNPGSAVDLDIDPIKGNFKRCFFSFGACITGFKFCRPVVMIDGTFMRGKHRGILLSAVGKDGNEGIPDRLTTIFAIKKEEVYDVSFCYVAFVMWIAVYVVISNVD